MSGPSSTPARQAQTFKQNLGQLRWRVQIKWTARELMNLLFQRRQSMTVGRTQLSKKRNIYPNAVELKFRQNFYQRHLDLREETHQAALLQARLQNLYQPQRNICILRRVLCDLR